MIDNINFVEKALIAGFKSNIDVNPRDNFFGASLYHPEISLKRDDNKEIFISLNKETYLKHEINGDDGIITTSTCLGSKFIRLTENKTVIYSSSHDCPSDNIINNFIK